MDGENIIYMAEQSKEAMEYSASERARQDRLLREDHLELQFLKRGGREIVRPMNGAGLKAVLKSKSHERFYG